jgi:ABC-type multidrug transport system fused ATPase/permease subunit
MTDQKPSAWELWRTLPRVRPYVRPYRKLAALSSVLTILNALMALARPWPLALMLDVVSGARPAPFGIADKYTVLTLAALGGFVLTLVIHAMNVGQSFVDSKLEQNMIFDLRSDLLEHCQRLSLTFHDQRRTGELMSRINNEASMLGSIVMSLPPLAESLLTLVGMAVIAFLIDWRIALVSLSAVPLVCYALTMYGTRVVPRLQEVKSLEWRSVSIVHEAMSMLRVIVSFGRERHEHTRFRTQGRDAVDARVAVTVRQTAFTLGVQTATAVGTTLVFFFGFHAVFNGELTTGGLVVLLSYIASIYAPLESISTTIGSLTEQLVSLRAAFYLLGLEPEVKEDRHPVELARARGEVVFDDVSFAYQERGNALEQVSFVVAPGQRVAVVGPTGAGKTTLMSLLIRFYDPASGAVRIDGVDLRRLSLQSLREQLAVVLQEPLLFSGTIAENIRYGRLDATDEMVVAAAVSANAHDFVSRLPHGYETEIGEKGAKLSGGERQRICVARAFVRDAPILILDEPTSSIDSKTEQVILEALDRLMAGRTSFMIAHRLSTIRDADLIIVLELGRLVQLGRHDELVEVDGLYRQLHETQSRPRQPRLTLLSGTQA